MAVLYYLYVICVCQVQVHIQCFIRRLEYYVCPCLLAGVGNIELAVAQGARERQKKDVSIYSGNCVVNSPPYIIHPN